MQTAAACTASTGITKKQIEATVVLGLISRKCRGKGICSITMESPDLKNQPCNHVSALLSRTDSKLTISVIKAVVKNCTRLAFFSSDFFEVEEAFVVPQVVSNLLSMEDYTIAPGRYRIHETKRYWTIAF